MYIPYVSLRKKNFLFKTCGKIWLVSNKFININLFTTFKMLDLKLFRENPEIIKKDLDRRKDEDKKKWVEEIIKLDQDWRRKKFEVDKLRAERNEVTAEIQKLKKAKKDANAVISKAKDLAKKLEDAEDLMSFYQEKRDAFLKKIPNLMHDSVPYGEDEKDNVEVKKWGNAKKSEVVNHVELGERLQVLDFEKSAKISGNGFYFLKGNLALLNQALIRFVIDYLIKKNYCYVEVPLMMRRKPYEGVTDLSDFENVMYKIENDDLYLIATSEHPLVAQFMNEVLDEDKLPLKICSYSMCFRKEIGSHGIDTKGLFRTHQFNKVEQVIICKPEDSWNLHKELVQNSEGILQELKLPYRVVNVCTGDLGIVAAKKYDIEVWRPRMNEYTEVSSISNCTEYQSRRLKIECGKVGGDKALVHTLNGTGVATSRVLVAILENYQNDDGSITVPDVLIPYMNGVRIIKN